MFLNFVAQNREWALYLAAEAAIYIYIYIYFFFFFGGGGIFNNKYQKFW